ncbi:MAG: PKD domain-containing protein [Solirubrobacteraceae bacterium]
MVNERGKAGHGPRRVARCAALTALFVALTPAAALAATRYASASGGGDCSTPANACDLTTAITGAGSGDVVIVEPGTYSIVNSSISAPSVPLTIEGALGGSMPTIDFTGTGELYSGGGTDVSYLDLDRTAGSGEVINDEGDIDHVLITGDASGGMLCQCDDGTLTNSVLVNTGADGAAAGINSNGGSGTEHYYNDTFIATQTGGAAIDIDLYYTLATPTDSPTQTFTAQNVIAYNAAGGNDVVVSADNDSSGTSTATITLTDSAYQNPLTQPETNGVATITNGGGRVTASPAFVDPADGDYAELWSSPTIDAGLNDATDDGSLDFAGLPRSVLGDTDIGAYEYQPLGTATATPSVSSAEVGTPVTFTGTGSDPNPGGGPLTYSWHFDDGGSASGASVSHTFTTPGPHTATLTVSDGSPHTATATTSVSMTAAPVTPTLTGVSLSVHQPKPAKGKTKAKRFSGAVSYTLNEGATVNGTITLQLKGKRVNGRCEAMLLRSADGKKLAACPKTRTVEHFTLNGSSGANTATFPSSSIPRKLPAGHYRITLTAVNGSLSSQPVSETFTVK